MFFASISEEIKYNFVMLNITLTKLNVIDLFKIWRLIFQALKKKETIIKL